MASLVGSTYTSKAQLSKMKYTKNRYWEIKTDEHLLDIQRIASNQIAPCMIRCQRVQENIILHLINLFQYI